MGRFIGLWRPVGWSLDFPIWVWLCTLRDVLLATSCAQGGHCCRHIRLIVTALWRTRHFTLGHPQICSAGGNGVLPPIDPNDPLAFLDKSIKPPACSEPVWFFLGLSMAVWNALISLIAAGWIATSRKS